MFLIGIKSLVIWDNATSATSVLDIVISIYIFLTQHIGQFAILIAHIVLERADVTYTLSEIFHAPVKSASTKTSMTFVALKL